MGEKSANEKKNRGSLYTFLLKGFVFLLLAVALTGAIFLQANYKISDEMYRETGYSGLLNSISNAKNGHYEGIETEDSLGEKGYFEILDQQGTVLYCSDRAKKNSYTESELKYIPSLEEDEYYTMEPLGPEGVKGFSLKCYKPMTDEDGNLTEDGSYYLAGTAVLDPDGNVTYTDMELGGSKLTDREMDILLESDGDDGGQTFLLKTSLQDQKGNERYVMLHIGVVADNYEETMGRVTMVMTIVFILAVIALIVGTALVMVAKIRRPLGQLNGAISAMAEGRREPLQDYSGPKEFVQVIDSFNAMEEKLQESEQEQEKLQEEKQRMLADISHDLKTPITVIRGYVDAVNAGLVTPESQKKFLGIVSQKTVMMEELINSFSDYSRLEHPDFRLQMQKGDICEYFREYMAGKYRELILAGYQVEIDIPEEKIYADFDHLQLKRVFENIITNALRYTEPGTTISGRLYRAVLENSGQMDSGSLTEQSTHTGQSAGAGQRAGTEQRSRTEQSTGRGQRAGTEQSAHKDHAGAVVIEIGDNGPGIPEDYREKIFDPFVTGDEARTSGKGTGLGLAIARKIVVQHGGSISLLTCQEGETGTVFRIAIPRL